MRKKRTHGQMNNCCFATPNNIVNAIAKKKISTSKRISPIISEDSIFHVLAEKLKDVLKKKTELFYTENKGFLNYPEDKGISYYINFYKDIIKEIEEKYPKKARRKPKFLRRMVSLEVNIDNEKIYNYHKSGYNNKTFIEKFNLTKKSLRKIIKHYKQLDLKMNNKGKFNQTHFDYILSYFKDYK